MSKFQKLRLVSIIIQTLSHATLTTLLVLTLLSDHPRALASDQNVIIFLSMDFCLYVAETTIAITELCHNHLLDETSPKIYHAASGNFSIFLYAIDYALAWVINSEVSTVSGKLFCLTIPFLCATIYVCDYFFDLTARLISPDPFIKPTRINRHRQIH